MGNDGGSIPTRRELVKEASRNPSASDLKEKQREHLAHRWSQCPVSHKALTKPIVSDYTGDLYNKDAILQYLLPQEASRIDKAEYDAFIQGRIKSLRDVVEVKFEVEVDDTMKTEKWLCPITAKELGAHVKAVYVVPCGHAFSQEAVREMKAGECSVCGESYERERDVVPILPSTEPDKEFVRSRMERLKAEGLSHSLKKDKSAKKRKALANGDEAETAVVAHENKKSKTQVVNGNGDAGDKAKVSGSGVSSSSNGIKNSATANLTKKVLEEEDAKKRSKLENENISSLYARKTNGAKERDASFMTRGFSVK